MHLAEKLQDIVQKAEGTLETEQEEGLITAHIKKADLDLWVTMLPYDDKYYAYDLSSELLPRELYFDQIRKGFTEQQRNDEILSNIERLLTRNFTFYNKYGYFTDTAGYILMPLDGIETKIPMKLNYFNFPEVEMKRRDLIFRRMPSWIKKLPQGPDREALASLAKATKGKFEQPREMNFVLYGFEDKKTLENAAHQAEEKGWKCTFQKQEDEPTPTKLLLTATKSDYVVTERAYVEDSLFFQRLADLYHVGYDGWHDAS